MTCTGFVRLLHFKPQQTDDGPQVTGGGATVMPTTPSALNLLSSIQQSLSCKNRFKPTERAVTTDTELKRFLRVSRGSGLLVAHLYPTEASNRDSAAFRMKQVCLVY